jgi:hypothetical protein
MPIATLPKVRRGLVRGFTPAQKDFIKFWAQGESIGSASVRAGYTKQDTTMYEFAKRPHVIAEYQKEKAKYEAAAQMTREKVMDMLKESYETAKLLSEPASMVAAAREIGKMCGYYAPTESRVKVDVSGNVMVQRLNSMSDEELLKMISAPKELTNE